MSRKIHIHYCKQTYGDNGLGISEENLKALNDACEIYEKTVPGALLFNFNELCIENFGGVTKWVAENAL